MLSDGDIALTEQLNQSAPIEIVRVEENSKHSSVGGWWIAPSVILGAILWAAVIVMVLREIL